MKNRIIFCVGLIVLGLFSCKNKDHGDNIYIPDDEDTAFTLTLEFPSIDSLMITADQYHINKDSAIIVLCHQAGFSRGAYEEVAPKLNAMGYNCIAIDQRSGNEANGIINETNKRAVAAGKPTDYLSAKQDIIATINWAKEYYKKDVILWGSSYSAALSLILAKENESVNTVLVFSPGEYLTGINVETSMNGLAKSSFLTSSKSEINQVIPFFDNVTANNKVHFKPTGDGVHGSRALWEETTGNAEYWAAVTAFLNSL